MTKLTAAIVQETYINQTFDESQDVQTTARYTVDGMIVPPSVVRQNIPIKKRFGEGEYEWAKRKAANERWAFTKALYEFHGQEYPAEYPEVEDAFQEPDSGSP